MVPSITRRTVLCSGSLAAGAALAGCSTLLGSSEPDDPDAGTDSYGVALRNELSEAYTVSMVARPVVGGDAVFEKTVESEPGTEQEWEQVFTEETQFVLEASVDHEAFRDQFSQVKGYVNPGGSNAPAVENLVVVLETQSVYTDEQETVRVVDVEKPDE